MEFTELTMKLLFIFFPGIIITLLYDRLTSQPQRSPFFFLVYSFVFGMSTYIILGLIDLFRNSNFFIFPLIYDVSHQIDSWTILRALIISIPLVIVLSYISNFKILYRVARFIKCSKQTGYHAIWEEFFDATDIIYVTIRDLKNNLMYQGWVESFSQFKEDREILLRDVLMFENESGVEINKDPLKALLIPVPLSNDLVVEVT